MREDRRDLAAHGRAVALVEVDEVVEIVVVRLARVTREEVLGEIDAAARGEVHREERDVRAHVGVAEAIGELDAVDDRRRRAACARSRRARAGDRRGRRARGRTRRDPR